MLVSGFAHRVLDPLAGLAHFPAQLLVGFRSEKTHLHVGLRPGKQPYQFAHVLVLEIASCWRIKLLVDALAYLLQPHLWQFAEKVVQMLIRLFLLVYTRGAAALGAAGIAAAALYVAALLNDEKKTQREVADVAGITEVTIRNRYKELLDKLNLEEKMKIKEAEARTEKERAEKAKKKK